MILTSCVRFLACQCIWWSERHSEAMVLIFFLKTLYHLFPLSIKWRYRASPSHWISSLTVVAWSFAISFCLFVIINKQKIKCVTMVVSVVWLVNAFNAFCLFVILWKILGIWLTQKKVSNVNYSLSRSLSTSLWKRSDFFSLYCSNLLWNSPFKKSFNWKKTSRGN